MANLAISKMKCEKINEDNAVIIGTKFGHCQSCLRFMPFLISKIPH